LGQDSTARPSSLFVGSWWSVLLRGLTAIAFGMLALIYPYRTVRTLVILFGFYALLHGMLSVAAAIGVRSESKGRWLLIFEGIIGVVAGVVALREPSLATIVLTVLLWVWAMITGFLRIGEAVRLRKSLPGELCLALSGVVTVLFGLMLMLGPLVGKVGVGRMIGVYALLLGLLEILLGRELRALRRNPQLAGL
jgi:uncharacterized membrane protein HdeD (DUF308 family)